MICCTSKYAQCCICQEMKKNFTKCIKCKNAHVCSDCMLSLCEHGQCSKCPLCRQLEWRKNTLKKTLIIPSNIKINTNQNYEWEDGYEDEDEYKDNNSCMYCYLSIMITRNICAYLIFSWLCGIMTILIVHPFDTSASVALIILFPLILGLIELACCIYCCFVKVCQIKTEPRSDYCCIFRLD